MSENNREVSPVAYAPVLDAALLARIHELNLDYVELLIADFTAGGRSAYFLPLPATVLESLLYLSREQRRAFAATSYTLYCIAFENTALLHAPADPAVHRASNVGCDAASGDGAHGAFCEIALFLAWHIAVSNPIAARVLYAMSDAMVARLAALPLWSLRRIASSCSGTLVPRWPANPCFWPDLARFAANNDVARLSAAQLLGNQLISVELERIHRAERRTVRVAQPSDSLSTPQRRRARLPA